MDWYFSTDRDPGGVCCTIRWQVWWGTPPPGQPWPTQWELRRPIAWRARAPSCGRHPFLEFPATAL